MKLNEVFDKDKEFPIQTKLHVLELISKRFKKDPLHVIKMDVWSILATLSEMAYDDSAYKRVLKEKKEMREAIEEAIEHLEGYIK